MQKMGTLAQIISDLISKSVTGSQTSKIIILANSKKDETN